MVIPCPANDPPQDRPNTVYGIGALCLAITGATASIVHSMKARRIARRREESSAVAAVSERLESISQTDWFSFARAHTPSSCSTETIFQLQTLSTFWCVSSWWLQLFRRTHPAARPQNTG